MTAGAEGFAAWPPAAVATVVAAALSARTMCTMRILRDDDAVLGTIVLELIAGEEQE